MARGLFGVLALCLMALPMSAAATVEVCEASAESTAAAAAASVMLQAKVQVKEGKERRGRGSSLGKVFERSAVPPWGHVIDIPVGITHVSINIGPNKSPIEVDGDSNLLILVEPLTSVVKYLQEHFAGPHVLVYQAAISNVTGVAEFHEYNDKGLSSSLATPIESAFWNEGYNATETVPVHTLRELLDAIPPSVPISFLKTDMQGYDLTAIRSAGAALLRVSSFVSEVYADGKPSYEGTTNEYNRDWVPYMKQLGYTGQCTDGYFEGQFHEMDCTWSLAA